MSSDAVFSPDRRWLAVSNSLTSSKGTKFWGAEIWDVTTLRKKHNIMQNDGDAAVNALAFSPDSQRLVCGRPNDTALFWNVQTGAKMQAMGEYGGLITAISFSPDGQLLAGISMNQTDITPEDQKNKCRVLMTRLWLTILSKQQVK